MTDENGDGGNGGDQPSRSELQQRVEQLENTVQKMLPTRRDALKMGATAVAAGGLGAAGGVSHASAQTQAAGQVGTESNPVDVEAASVSTDGLYTAGRSVDYVLQSSSPHVGVGDDGQISSNSDAAVVLQALIDDGQGSVSVDRNFYVPSSAVTVNPQRDVRFRGWSDWALDADVTAFTLASESALYGPFVINMNGTGGSSPVVLVDGAQWDYGTNTGPVVEDVVILGDSATGEEAAAKLAAGPSDGQQVTWTKWRNCTFNKGQVGTLLEAPDPGAGNTTWTNANMFSECIWTDNQIAISLVQDSTNGTANAYGNRFSGEVQATSSMDHAIHCEGANNYFDLFIWDWSNAATGTSIELTAESRENWIDVNAFHSRATGRVADDGTRNVINGHAINNGDPNTTGDWNGVSDRAGAYGTVIVWDTSVSPNAPYIAGPDDNWTAL